MRRITNEEFSNRVHALHSNINILGEYVNKRTRISVECKIDGYKWSPIADSLARGVGCPVCSNRKIIKGINDLWSTHPELATKLLHYDDGYKYSLHSSVVVDWVCPNCETIIHKSFATVADGGLSCPRCSDGKSYPNKFIYNLLMQIGVDFESEFRIGNYYYDIKLHDSDVIIEMDGGFHFCDNNMTMEKHEDVLIRDKNKENEAIQKGYHVIRVDCKKSDFEYIKNNILKSDLNNILNLDKITIDWNEIEINSNKSLIKQVCDIYNSGITNTKDIADIIQIIGKNAILSYLHKGEKIGLCNYIPQFNKRKVKCVTTNKTFESIAEAKRFYNINSNAGIIECCKGNRKYAGRDFITNKKLEWSYV